MIPAEIIEKALRKNMRVSAGVPMSGAEAEDAAGIAVDALAVAGLVVAAACGCGHPIGDCHSCGQPRCYYCDPGLGKHYRPMKCNERHAPHTLPERTNRA